MFQYTYKMVVYKCLRVWRTSSAILYIILFVLLSRNLSNTVKHYERISNILCSHSPNIAKPEIELYVNLIQIWKPNNNKRKSSLENLDLTILYTTCHIKITRVWFLFYDKKSSVFKCCWIYHPIWRILWNTQWILRADNLPC